MVLSSHYFFSIWSISFEHLTNNVGIKKNDPTISTEYFIILIPVPWNRHVVNIFKEIVLILNFTTIPLKNHSDSHLYIQTKLLLFKQNRSKFTISVFITLKCYSGASHLGVLNNKFVQSFLIIIYFTISTIHNILILLRCIFFLFIVNFVSGNCTFTPSDETSDSGLT